MKMMLIKANITHMIVQELMNTNDIIHEMSKLPDNDLSEWREAHDEVLKAAKHLTKAYAAASDITLRGAKK